MSFNKHVSLQLFKIHQFTFDVIMLDTVSVYVKLSVDELI